MDWSDHAIWWPEKNIWLDKTRWTLDQFNVTADATVHFTPMHKTLRIQLPDLRYVDCSVDFSIRTFNAVYNLCNELEIRHPEELSLCKPLEGEHLKFNYGEFKRQEEKKRRVTLGAMPNGSNGNKFLSTSRRQLSASVANVDAITVNDRPDTNTFIGSSATLGRKNHSMTISNSNPTKFRSLGRAKNGSVMTIDHLHMNGSGSKRKIGLLNVSFDSKERFYSWRNGCNGL